MLSTSCLLNGGNYAGYIEWNMLLKKFGCEDIMTIYAIAVVPRRRPSRYRFPANLSLPSMGTGDARGQFTDDVGNAVPINGRDVALCLRRGPTSMHPDTDFMIYGIKE